MIPASDLVVYIDKDFEDILPRFLERKKSECLKLLQAIEQTDFELIESVAHQIKGSSGSYGLHELSDLGKALEISALQQDLQTVKLLILKIQYFLEHLQVTYK